MEGLSNALTNHGPVKVFADNHEDAIEYDQNSKLNIERISGFKIFRKYRKANLVKDFIKQNQIRACFFDHWKSIENIDHWIVGCLRIDPHISHASLAEVKEWLDIVKPKKAYLSHMTAHLDFKDTFKYLDNPNYMPGYDGQILEIK